MGITTAWMGGGTEPPRAGFADLLASVRADPAEGKSLAEVLAGRQGRAGWYGSQPEAQDPDEVAAGLLARGYQPGMGSDLAMRLQDAEAELAGQVEANERAIRRAEHIRREHAAGRITALQGAQMGGTEPDLARAEQLQRRVDRLRRQLGDAQAAIAPAPGRELDPVEQASRRAHAAFREATQARWAEAQGARRVPRERRPFAGRGIAVRAETVTCADCIKAGATPEESFLLHSDPDPAAMPDGWSPPADYADLPAWSASRGHGPGREITRAAGGATAGVR